MKYDRIYLNRNRNGKKSLKGLICVAPTPDGRYEAIDQCPKSQEELGELQTVYENGVLIKDWTLEEIRRNVNASIKFNKTREE